VTLALRVAATAMLLVASRLGAQAPSTDIFLAPIKRVRDSIVVGPAKNITSRAGYDNQPSFTADSRAILYTAVGGDAQSDIWRYDIAGKRTAQLTHTPESEYSATVMPGGRRMSVIRVERDSTQRLWSFALDGSDPQILLTALKPVGYHAWLGPAKLVTFVLGTPATLHVIDSDGGGDTIRARDIGRALQKVPGRDAFSYTHRDSARTYSIVTQSVVGEGEAVVVKAPSDNEYHAWTPDGVLLTVTQGTLVRWNSAIDATSGWLPVADISAGVKNISRLAVSPDGKWLVFAAEPASP
jgi:Tol biopolymer transport system component